MCIAVMMTNTTFIFNSSIDSYFLTVFAVIVPKYARNSINVGTFEAEEKLERDKNLISPPLGVNKGVT